MQISARFVNKWHYSVKQWLTLWYTKKFHNCNYAIIYSTDFNSYLGVSAKLSPGAPHGYGDFALVGGSLSQPELLQVNKKDSIG